MAGLFQPKRVQVPGLLSDEGLSVALKNLSDTTKAGAEAAPPNTSAIDAANQITTEALKPQPTVKTAAPRVPGVELSAGAPASDTAPPRVGFGGTLTGFDVGKAIVQAGTLTPAQGEADRAERAAQAGAEAEVATGELAEKTKLLSPDEREAIGLPPLTPEDTMRLSSSIALEQQIVKEKAERAKFIKEGPAATQTEWLNIAQVSTRSAIQMGVGTLRYPADIWDTLAAIEKGSDEVKKSEVSVYLDNVDKALTAMMPGDKTRSKDFTTKLAAGGGSMVGFMITGWVGRAVGLPAWLTTGTLGAAVEGDSLYQEADTFGATATQKLIALFAGSALGVTEAVPIDRAFMRADVASGGMIRNLLANTTSTSLEEFIQEASQSLGEDIIAKYGAGYDPKREISVDKALENGLIGAIVGGTVGGATTLLSNGQPVEHLTQDEAKITETVDAALAEEQSRFASIIGDEAVDGEGALAAPAQGASGSEAAGSQAAAARPDPVVADQPRGDAVQEIVKPTNVAEPVKPVAAAEQQDVVLNPTAPAEQQVAVKPAPAVETPEFKAWFGDSKGVSESGAPQTFYHGTSSAFSAFARVEGGNAYGDGFYFTKSPEAASRYATGENVSRISPTGNAGPNVMPVYLKYDKPFTLRKNLSVGDIRALEQAANALTPGYFKKGELAKTFDRAYEPNGDNVLYQLGPRGQEVIRKAGFDAIDAPDQTVVFEPTQIKSAIANIGTFDPTNPNIDEQVANPIAAVQLEPIETAPLPNAGAAPNPDVVKAARAYTAAAGLPTRRQRDFVAANPARSNRIAQAYADMKHEPADPAVLSSYQALVEEVQAQYVFASAAGDLPPAENIPVYPPDHPLATVADQFWALHRFFGQGLEGASDPENMWQAHARLFSADALPAFTAETRGAAAFTERWGEPAERKVGQLPSWTWQEGVDDTTAYAVSAPVEMMAVDSDRFEFHLSTEPGLVAGKTFAEQTRTASTSGERGGTGDIYTTRMPQMWSAQMAYEDVAQQPSHVYLVEVPEPAAVDPSSSIGQQTITPAASARVVAYLGEDRGAETDTPFDVGRFEYLRDKWLQKNSGVERFHDAVQAAVSASPYGAVTKVYSPAKYAKMRTFLSPDGRSGFALDGEKIVSLFGADPSQLRKIVDTAVANGGRTFEGFDAGLPEMLASLGFRETGRKPWNESYAPKDWPAALGKPDVVSMEWSGDIEQSVAAYATKTDAFVSWFGDSKVVDEAGVPLVVYHGTAAAPFDAFHEHRPAFFTPSSAYAEGYASKGGGKSRVVEAYLSIGRPFDPASDPEARRVFNEEFKAYLERRFPSRAAAFKPLAEGAPLSFIDADLVFSFLRRRKEADASSYDGMHVAEDANGTFGFSWVPLENTQIKATANRGTFDPADPNIDRMTGTSTVRQPYIAEPTRPTKGIPSSPATAALKAEDARLSLISKEFSKLLDLTAKQGRLVSGRDTMGEYHRRSATIRMRTHDDFSTLAHEAGHAIHDSRATVIEALVQRNLREIYEASKIYAMDISQEPAVKRQREGFAEFFRVYVTNRLGAEQRWPTLTADFDQMLRRTEPKIAAGLDNIHSRVQMWTNISSKQLIRNMIVDGRREMGLETAYKELRENGVKTWIEETARRTSLWFTERMINRNVALAELQARLLNQGEEFRGAPLEVPLSELPYQNLRTARNSGSLAQIELADGVYPYRGVQQPVTRGLRDALLISQGLSINETPISLDKELEKDFGAYLIARRAWEEWKRFDAGEITRAPIAAQKGEIARTIKEYETSNPEFIEAAKIAHRFAMGLWHKRYEAGLIDKDTYEEVIKRAFYVPLQRDISDKAGAEGAQIQFGSSALTKPGRFRGSDREIISPMTVLMQMTMALEKQISENDAKKFLAVLADRAGAAGALVERIPANQIVGQTYSVQQVVARLLGDVPTDQEIADYMAANNATREQALDNLVKDSHVDPADAADLMSILAGSIEKGDLMTLFKAEQAGTLGENVVFFWENGKVAAMRINDMELAASVVNTLNAVGRENMDLPLTLIATTSSAFRSAITKWPDFIINNFVIGEFTNFMLTDTGYIPIYSGLKGIANELLQTDVAKQYNAAKGIMGGMNVAALHRSRVDRDIKALRSKGYWAQAFGDMDNSWDIVGVAKGLARVTEISESGGRFSVFEGARKRALADGLNEFDASFEASYVATDLIDFGLNGSSTLTVRRLVPFLNAALQGLYKTARTLGGGETARRKGVAFALTAYFKNINNLPLSRAEMKELKTGRRLWIMMTLAGMISAVITFLQKDDEDYQETTEYLRATTWVFSLGKKNGEVITIPKPRELAILANAMERGIEWANGDPTAVGKAIRSAQMAVTPPTAVPLFETIAEVQANKDFFTNRDIVPKYMKAWAPEQQFDNYTSSLAKWFGGISGQSPMVVDHVLRGMGASAYRDISNMATAADPSRSDLPMTDWPLLRRYYRDVKKGSQATADFWAQASNENGKLGQAAASYKREVEAGTPQSANYRLSKMSADERAYAVLMTHFKPEEKRLNPFYRATQLTSIVSGMRREIETELGIGDSTFEKPTREELLAGAEYSVLPKMTKGAKTEVSNLLSELARREVRNTLIITKQPGWADKKTLPVEETLEQLERISPDTYDEFNRRRVKAKVYDAQSVYDYWPEVRDRLVSDGPDAILSDAVAVAGVVF